MVAAPSADADIVGEDALPEHIAVCASLTAAASSHTSRKDHATISGVGAFLAFTVARYLPYAVLSRGMIRSAFSRSIAIRSAPAKTAPSPFTCSSPVRYG